MMTIKRFVKATALVIGLVVLIAVSTWLLVDDVTLISALEKQIETVSDTRDQPSGRRQDYADIDARDRT